MEGVPPEEIGWVLTAVLLVLVIVSAIAGRGGIRRNPYAGIRLPPLQRSDGAWRAGHAAAVVPSAVACVAVLVLAVIAIGAPAAGWGAIAAFVLGVVWALVRAVRAANAA